VTDTANAFDVVSVKERMLDDSRRGKYQRFCGLTAYETSQFDIPRSKEKLATPEFGYCQLFPTNQQWNAAAWMGNQQLSAPDSHIACSVACYDDWYDNQKYKGVFRSHAIYDSQRQIVAAFNGYVVCSLSYINIQSADVGPLTSHNSDTQWAGCWLQVDVTIGAWAISVVSNVTHTVRCGVVCTCLIDPGNVQEKHLCIRPMNNISTGTVQKRVSSDGHDERLDWFIPTVIVLVMFNIVWVTMIQWRWWEDKLSKV
jgi:hypothetical protein